MNKFTYLLLLLFCMMGGVMNAQNGEQTAAKEITALDQLKNGKTYTLVAPRGFVSIKDQKAIYGYEGSPRPDNADDQFAILEYKGNYYLFNAGKKKFVSTKTTKTSAYPSLALVDTPDDGFAINATNNPNNPWYFSVPDQSNNWLNMGGAREIKVDNWKSLDDGNQFKITEVGALDQETLEAAMAKLNIDYAALINQVYDESKINKGANEAFVGYITDEAKAKIAEAKKTALASPSKTAYNTFLQAIKDNSVGFEEGAYYLIELQNNIAKKYPSTQNMHFKKDGSFPHERFYDDRVIRRTTENDPLLPRLWKIEKQDNGTYKIRNANTGCNWSSYVNNGIDMPVNPTTGGTYSIQFLPCNEDKKTDASPLSFNTKFTITIDGHFINAFQGDYNNVICDYGGNHIDDAGNHWAFKKVTEVPVKVGATGWASVCLPFAVTLPSDVKAYIATSSNGNVVTLQEVNGTIAANTAMMITAQANTNPSLTISKEQGQVFENNLFKGVTVERIEFEAEETFALGAKDAKAVLMKNHLSKEFTQEGKEPVTTYYVPANKAYILTTDLNPAAQAAAMLQFNFGDNTTGIDGVEVDNEKDTIYYDLNGRRVLYPTQGVYVTNTGKKVFIR